MKKLMMMMLVVVLIGFQVTAQKGQPILSYGDYTVEQVRVFALSDSNKAEKFRQALILIVNKQLKEAGENYIVNEYNISWVFDQVEEQETWLEAGQWKNSRWMAKNSLDFYVSKTRYEGNAGIFEYGKCCFPLYKSSCANLIDPILKRKTSGSFINHNAQVPIEININLSGVKDTLYKEVWIQSPEQTQPVIVEINHYGEQQGYYRDSYYPSYYSMPVMFSFPLISWGMNYGCNYIGGSDYYYNNQVTNNITNISNTNTNTNININKNYPNPVDPIDTGGPGGADTQPANLGGPGGVNTQPVSGGNSGGANTGKSASIQRSNSSRRSTTSSSANSSLKSASRSQRSSTGYRTSSYRSSSTPRSSSYRSSSSSRSSSYRTSSSRGNSRRSSSFRPSSSSYRSSGSSMSSRGGSSFSGGRSRSLGSRSFSGGSSRSSSGRR